MSSLLRRLRAGKSSMPAAQRAIVAKRKAAVAREKRVASLEAAVPTLPPGINRVQYSQALAFFRRVFPELKGRELHDKAVEACVAFEHEQKVQLVMKGQRQ